MKIGVIDVGGGFRGIYAAGVLDRCLEDQVQFDYCIGVSAGSADVASYLAGQKGRNYVFYSEYGRRRKYMSLRNFIFKKSYIDLDYVYSTLSNSDGEYPLDYRKIAENGAEMEVVATDAADGNAKYFTKADIRQDEYGIFKASSAIPMVCHPYEVGGHFYYDGAVSDPIPLERALERGCDKVVLILTKPADIPRSPERDQKLAGMLKKKYPQIAEGLAQRAERYNRGVALARKLEAEGRALIIAPESTDGADTLTRKKEILGRFYRRGVRDGGKIREFAEKK